MICECDRTIGEALKMVLLLNTWECRDMMGLQWMIML